MGYEEYTDEQIDQIYNEAISPSDSGVQEAQPKPEMFKFTANGKEIEASKDDVLKWASQGHDYSQKMHEFKQEREKFDSEFGELKQIHEYAKENPDWLNHVKETWEKRDAIGSQGTTDNFDADAIIGQSEDPTVRALTEKFGEFQNFINEFKAKEGYKAREEEDKLLDMTIKSIKEQYKDEDWISKDEKGLTLESRILRHAKDLGIDASPKAFNIAFKDYMHDKLLAKAHESGKMKIAEDMAIKTKLGLLGRTLTPTKGLQKATSIKSKSYDELMQEGLREIEGSQ